MQNLEPKERKLLDEADDYDLIANLTEDVGRRSYLRKAALDLRDKAAKIRRDRQSRRSNP